MSGNPDIPFDDEAARFNRKVDELVRIYKERYPHLSDASLHYLAEEMTEPHFFESHQRSERPN